MRVNGDPLTKSDVANDLWDLAVKRWGEREAEGLRAQIADTADWIATIGDQSLDIWADEPDYLTGACASPGREGE